MSWTVLGMAVYWAVLGKVIEVPPGAARSSHARGSTRAVALANVDSLVGGTMSTTLQVPMVGTVIGARLGPVVGSLIGDRWAGRPLFPSVEAGWGAAVGWFWGTVSKLAVCAIIVIILALTAFF